jgi:dihydroorotate dehydrogenase (fumarate)
MNTKVNLLGLTFENPVLPAAGPLTEGLSNLLYLNESPLGGLVTKTISVSGALVKKPCIAATEHMVFNTELWSEHDLKYWTSQLPHLVDKKKKPIGVSVGYTEEQLGIVIPEIEEYADFIEVSTHYNKASLESLVKCITAMTKKPVLIKMSPHIDDDLHFVETILKSGASGIVAFNSFGPGIVIDLKNRALLLGNEDGHSWISGPAIKPFALNRIAKIRRGFPNIPIIGCGGVATAADVLEMILAGADLVQVLSSALIGGRETYATIVNNLEEVMKDNQIESIKELRDTPLTRKVYGKGNYPIITDQCIGCQMCVKICPFAAYEKGRPPILDKSKCIRCGLCESRCVANAIKGVLT